MIHFTRDSFEIMRKIMDNQDDMENNKASSNVCEQYTKLKINPFLKEYHLSSNLNEKHNNPLKILHRSSNSIDPENNNTNNNHMIITPTNLNNKYDHSINHPKLFNNSSTYKHKSNKLSLNVSMNNGTLNTSNDRIYTTNQDFNTNGSSSGNGGGGFILYPNICENIRKKPPIKPNSKGQFYLQQGMVITTLEDTDKSMNMPKSRHETPKLIKNMRHSEIINNENKRPSSSIKPSILSNSLSLTGYNKDYQYKSPNKKMITTISPHVSPYSKVNANKNLLLQYGDINVNEGNNKNIFSQFLTKADVFNFISPKFTDKSSNDNEEIDSQSENQFIETGNFPNYNNNSSNKKLLADSTKFNPNQGNDENNKNIIQNTIKSISTPREMDLKKQNTITSKNSTSKKKSKCRHESLTQNSLRKIIEIDDKAHRLSSPNRNPIGKTTANTLKNLMNYSENPNPKQAFNTEKSPYISAKSPKLTYSSSKIASPTSKISSLNSNKDMNINVLSPSKDDMLKSPNEKTQLGNIILDLKNKLQEKELELLDIKNSKMKYDSENQNLMNQVKDLMALNKSLEESIKKLKQINSNHEKEIDYLKKSKQMLETNLNEALEASESLKIKRYENKLEQKNQEISELNDKLNKMMGNQGKLQDNEQIQSYEIQLKEKNAQINKLEQELANLNIIKKDHASIEKKIIELEDMQNKLIEENMLLKTRLNMGHQTKSIKDKENEHSENVKIDPKELIDYLKQTGRKLKDVDELLRNAIQILYTAIRGEEPPIELLIKNHKRIMSKRNNNEILKEVNQVNLTPKQISMQNNDIVEKMQKALTVCLDDVCDQYVQKFGSECNLH